MNIKTTYLLAAAIFAITGILSASTLVYWGGLGNFSLMIGSTALGALCYSVYRKMP